MSFYAQEEPVDIAKDGLAMLLFLMIPLFLTKSFPVLFIRSFCDSEF